jgi:predicted secreted acid phosphatase
VLKQEIVAYVESGACDSDIKAVIAPAVTFVTERAAAKRLGERLAAVLDIDETAISNFAQMRAQDFGDVPSVWDAWVARGEAPAIAPVLEFFRAARVAGVEVIFITGRRESDRSGSEKNLRAAGFGDYAALWLKPNGANSSTEQFKTETRRRSEAEGRPIVANIGDQASDLAGGFSERTYRVPGPFYQTK